MADEPVKARCIFCGATVTIDEEIPLVSDEDAWRRMAEQHQRDCRWVRTRAGRLKDEGGRRKEEG